MAELAWVVEGKAPPRGAYPHLRRAGDFVFVSGLSARRPDGTIAGVSVDERGIATFDIEAQTAAVITNIADVIGSIGGSLSCLVELSAFLVDMADFDGYNRVYGQFFDADGPARTTVAVHQLPHPHFRIEVRACAWLPRPEEQG